MSYSSLGWPTFCETLDKNSIPVENNWKKAVLYVSRLCSGINNLFKSKEIQKRSVYGDSYTLDEWLISEFLSEIAIALPHSKNSQFSVSQLGLFLSNLRQSNRSIIIDWEPLWFTTDDCLYYLTSDFSINTLNKILELFWRSGIIDESTFSALTGNNPSDQNKHWFQWKLREWKRDNQFFFDNIRTVSTPPSSSSSHSHLPLE
jgi:hypothetical protein